MSSTPPPATPRAKSAAARSRARPRPIVLGITGAASGLGAVLAARALRRRDIAAVVGLDVTAATAEGIAAASPERPSLREPGPVGAVTWRLGDVRAPDLVDRLAGVGALVHLAVLTTPETDPELRRAVNVAGTETVIAACAAAGVPRLVLVTSAAVHGPRADNPIPLDDDAPLRAEADGLMADLLEIERLAAVARRAHPGLSVTVVRPAAVVGADLDTVVTRHFSAPRLLTVRGAEMRWQFVHVDDLADALLLAARGLVSVPAAGAGAQGWLAESDVERLSGLRRLELPAAVVFGAAERLHRAGVIPAPASDLSHVVYPWVVSSTALRAAGWRPRFDNAAALGVLLAAVEGERAIVGRRLEAREATIAGASAAGATVAVLGAAAFVRRARRLRGH